MRGRLFRKGSPLEKLLMAELSDYKRIFANTVKQTLLNR